MFVQVIEGRVKDPDLLLRQMDRWAAEIKPHVTGYLGSTGGIAADGRSVWVARFESAEAARANSSDARQDAWWNETAKAYEGEPTFHDCSDVDVALGGGSDDAGFVQVIEARATNAAEMRRRMQGQETDLGRARPDLLGVLVAWHPDGAGVTQVCYFRSEAEAREMERQTSGDPMAEEFMAMFDGPPSFVDLAEPRFD